jgi:hypothetical protein
MKYKYPIIIALFILLPGGCITSFIPETNENSELLVIEGLITDEPGPYEVKVSMTMPLGKLSSPEPVPWCLVSITDDDGNKQILHEVTAGHYRTAPSFIGVAGKKYILEVTVPPDYSNGCSVFRSDQMELLPVPPIDSVYFERRLLKERQEWSPKKEGAEVFLDTHDPTGRCNFYRWDYIETWEFHLPYPVPNDVCWVTEHSDEVNIKNISALEEKRIMRFPLEFISNETDRLKVKYSVLVNQYALNMEEFTFWEEMKNINDNVGSLYDVIPSSVGSNIYCVDDPTKKVLGYFSVSGKSSKRLFIDEDFMGIINPYSRNVCEPDTIWGNVVIPGLGIWVWMLEDHLNPYGYRVITNHRECADCTLRGTNIEPDFWRDDK